MSEQEVLEKEFSEEPKEIPCIYGSEIRAVCSVRQEARRNAYLDINKWVKPNIGLKDEHLRGLAEMLNHVVDSLASMNLDRYCDHCPWLKLYMTKQP